MSGRRPPYMAFRVLIAVGAIRPKMGRFCAFLRCFGRIAASFALLSGKRPVPYMAVYIRGTLTGHPCYTIHAIILSVGLNRRMGRGAKGKKE